MEKEELFGNLPREVWAELDSISSPVSFTKGAVLFVEGQKPAGIFVLRNGQVKLSANSVEGKPLIMGKAEPGDVLGLPTAISGKPNELTAEALKPVQCSFIARNMFLEFLLEHGTVAVRVAEILSDMYDATFGQLRQLGFSTATEKLARLLLDLPAEPSQGNGHNGNTKTLFLTHKEIAEMIGSSRETVTRLFARFKREQLVAVNDSQLRILDRAGLEQLLAL